MNTQPIVGMEDGLIVNSLFETIQGEGPLTGYPAVFLRLSGCVLRCTFCDTEYASGDRIDLNELVEHLQSLSSRLLVITGGEPLRQGSVGQLINTLGINWKIQIETSGAVCHPHIIPFLERCMVVCSPKTGKVQPIISEKAFCWKYVLEADKVDTDGLPVGVAKPYNSNIWVGPCWDQHYSENLKAAIHSCQTFGYRLNVQVHKYIQVP